MGGGTDKQMQFLIPTIQPSGQWHWDSQQQLADELVGGTLPPSQPTERVVGEPMGAEQQLAAGRVPPPAVGHLVEAFHAEALDEGDLALVRIENRCSKGGHGWVRARQGPKALG